MLQPDLCDYGDAYIVVKGIITVTNPDNNAYDRNWLLKIMHYLLAAFQNQ